jgi:flavin-dependent dehydrogenase
MADGLVLGSSAVAFDPICGDGVATAVRGGILAAAVAAEAVGNDDPGLDQSALAGHYRAMLIAAMRRHLAVSWPFYERGGNGPWWREQADALAQGHDWCTRQLAAAGEARFVLAGDRLVARECAA